MKTLHPLRIVLAGGNGFLGHSLIQNLQLPHASFIILSRTPGKRTKGAKTVWWDGEHTGDWCKELEGADVLINLCGRSVDCRYTEKNKKDIFDSRLLSTTVLGQAINETSQPPKLWINSASATIHRHAEDKPMNDDNIEFGDGFSVDVCKKWEAAFEKCLTPSTRKIALRISMVLGRNAGVLPVMLKLARRGLGGTMGNGKQYMSWIHEKDFAGIIAACIKHEEWEGTFNCSAPEPIPNKAFMQLIRKAAGVSFGLPASVWMLEIGAFFLRTETELVLKSRRVVPSRLMQNGFAFQFKNAADALTDLTNS
jgi:uncharacterized protein (TIGR01777 family)